MTFYLREEGIKIKREKKLFFIGVLKITEKKTDSGAASISQRYGSEDPGPHPDPYRNVSKPENGFLGYILEIGKVH
jgi:hypothetical protein